MQAKIIFLLILVTFTFGYHRNTANASTVSSEVPSFIYIPKIAKSASVIPVGITKSGNMDVPHNFVQAGWYQYGALPGQVGSAILDGHVDNGATIPGVFKRLHELSVGDDIYVVNKSGKTLHFRVKDASVYSRTASSAPILANSDQALLKIITCHGKYIAKDKTYDKRLVVTAVLVG